MTEITKEQAEEIAAQFAAEGKLDAAELYFRGLYASKEDTPEGFRHFYWCIYGRECPAFALREWIPQMYEAHRENEGVLLEAWRGSTKSTIMLAFAAFLLGHKPYGSELIVAANDDAANKMSALLATIIERTDGWQKCFPWVVPDKERGWGAAGYFLKDTREDYNKWIGKTIQDHGRDPSFVAAGITSSDVVGKHPSLLLLLDDIHDEKNTASDREVESVKRSLTANILPTMSRAGDKPFIGVACTPWRDTDAYAFLKAGGQLRVVHTPVYREVDGERVYAWPEWWNDEQVEKWKKQVGSLEFARMFLCDLTAANGLNLKIEWLHEYEHSMIGASWPVYFGVDFASTADRIRNDKHDYFALAVGKGIPGGGVVVVDGIRERLSTGEAMEKVIAWAALYPSLRVIGVEKWGKGEEFFNLLRANTSLPVLPMPVKGTAPRGKGERFEKQMAPMFEYSRAWVSKAETPFLRAFKQEWAQFPGDHDDTLDAVYWMLMVAAGHLMPSAQVDGDTLYHSKRSDNPFNGLGRR